MIAQHAADLSPSLFACNAWMLVWLCPVAWKEWMRREREAATRQLEEEAAEVRSVVGGMERWREEAELGLRAGGVPRSRSTHCPLHVFSSRPSTL